MQEIKDFFISLHLGFLVFHGQLLYNPPGSEGSKGIRVERRDEQSLGTLFFVPVPLGTPDDQNLL